MGSEHTEDPRPRHHHKVLRDIWLGKTHVVPETKIATVQVYPAPKNVKEVQTFTGIWESGGLLFPTCHSASVLYTTW